MDASPDIQQRDVDEHEPFELTADLDALLARLCERYGFPLPPEDMRALKGPLRESLASGRGAGRGE